MMKIRLSLVVITTILLLQETSTQDDLFQNRPKGTSGETFYLDQPSSCRSTSSYSVTGKTTIIGRSGSSGSSIPNECTITLASFAQKPMKFALQISAMNLNCDLKFYILDGGSTSTLLKSYDCHKRNENAFDRIYTTGSKVTFKLIRERIDISANYEIRIIAETIQDVIVGGDGWQPRFDRNERDVRKFDTDIIMILMSVAFIFAFLVYAIVVGVYWKRRNKGQEKWTERDIGYDNPSLGHSDSQTLAYVEQLKTQPPDDPRGQQMTTFNKMNGRQPQSYQTRMARSSIDADSVFEGEKGEKIKKRHENNNGNGAYNNAAYQQTPVRSRARSSLRNTSSSHQNKKANSPTSSDVPSLSQQNHKKLKRRVDPEPIPSDSEEVESTSVGINTDPELTDQGVQCEAEEEPEIPTSQRSTTTTSVGVGGSPVLNVHKHSPNPRRNHRPPSYEQAQSDNEYLSRSSPKPPSQAGVPYVHYSNPTLRRPQPVYSQNQDRRPYTPDYYRPAPHSQVESENSIPVYSYLVNRGYHIDDGQSSCGGTSHDSRIDHSNDSDLTANLDCGIELMRR